MTLVSRSGTIGRMVYSRPEMVGMWATEHAVKIAKDNRPQVRLEVLPEARRARQLGTVRELIVRMDEDFDAPLDDFAADRQPDRWNRPW